MVRTGTKALIAVSIKPSPEPIEQDDGTLLCKMNYVSAVTFRETLVQCTRSIYLQIDQHRYTANHTHHFKLRLDDNGVVKSIDVISPPADNSIFNTTDKADENRLLLTVDRDGGVSVKSTPSGLSPDIVDEIVGLAEEASGVFSPDQFLGDRFMVESIIQVAGQTTVAINPKIQ